jgi:hypothetical protein
MPIARRCAHRHAVPRASRRLDLDSTERPRNSPSKNRWRFAQHAFRCRLCVLRVTSANSVSNRPLARGTSFARTHSRSSKQVPWWSAAELVNAAAKVQRAYQELLRGKPP